MSVDFKKGWKLNMFENVLIVGVGRGLSASLARLFYSEGMNIVLAARNTQKLESLAQETKAELISCDASKIDDVELMFQQSDKYFGSPSIVIFNPSARVRGPISSCDPVKVKEALETTCFGAFLVAQKATERMKKLGRGSIFFTGATAGVKGFPNSSVFAMGKFGLRGLAQALARELHPHNIHVGHFVIDGIIDTNSKNNPGDEKLDPDHIANCYLQFHKQERSAWSWEIELRPWTEKF